VGWFDPDREKHRILASAWVVPAPARCVQCGVCSFNCPMQIDVRRHVWLGQPVYDSHCVTCGQCVERCPRGLLRFLPIEDTPPAQRSSGAWQGAAPAAPRDEQADRRKPAGVAR
jgi:NAD-dependent dihydropyrimidine dehydrogenase PreA subunit